MGKRERMVSQSPLFAGIEEEEIGRLLPCLRPKIVALKEGESVLPREDAAHQIAIVLKGVARKVEDDGGVLAQYGPGDSVGEVCACAETALPDPVVAGEDCEVLRIDCRRALTPCDHSCKYHKRLMRNLVRIVARRAVEQEEKVHILSQRTTRDKIMTYLRAQAREQEANEFTIPLDRQGLADYLGVERSAMSTEIGKLRQLGLIETKKSWFKLL